MKGKILDNQIALWDVRSDTRQFFDDSCEKAAFKPYNRNRTSYGPAGKPRGLVLEKGLFWCPYCRQKVVFVKDRYLGIKRCPLCGISENDFHVKKENKKKR